MKTDITPYTDKLPTKKVAAITVDLTKASDAAANLLAQAERAEITDKESYATGGDLIKIARVEAAKVEDLRTELVGPYNKLVKFINTEFKKSKEAFTDVRSVIETKMLKWKAIEDKRLADEAKAEAKRIEEEALAKAALEAKDEDQDEVMEVAAEAAAEVIEESSSVGLARGNFGSSTGSRTTYSTNVINQTDFLRALIKHIDDGNKRGVEIGSLIEFRKGGMNKFAQNMLEAGVKKMPGAEFVSTDKIRVY